jgi:hypothetical protein
MLMHKSSYVAMSLLLMLACGGKGSSNPTGPSTPIPTNPIPNVAGSYSGNATFVFPELGRSTRCPVNTSVAQTGSSIHIAAILYGGSCNFSRPGGEYTIDTAGTVMFGNSISYYEPSCGTYRLARNGEFSGLELRFSEIATSGLCYNYNATVNLSR